MCFSELDYNSNYNVTNSYSLVIIHQETTKLSTALVCSSMRPK